jgi:RecD/TraA family predicted helicase
MARTAKEKLWANRNVSAGMARGDVELIGAVERIIFFNPEDGATVAALRTGETVRGQVEDAELERGVTYRFLGHWAEHFRYGRQFHFGTVILHAAGDRTGTIRYLTQVAPHVGHVTAAKLWQLWGPECVEVLRATPEKVIERGGILSAEHAYEASDALRREAGLERTRIDLWGLFDGRGFPRTLQRLCILQWGAKAAEAVRRNPFRLLVEQFPGCGFKRCDRLYLDLGYDPLALKRQTLAAWNALYEDREGNTWMSRGVAARAVREVASAAPRPDEAIALGIRAGWLAVREDSGKGWITEADKARNESELAARVRRLRKWPDVGWPALDELDPQLSAHQREQLARVLGSPVGLLTGTPGTGKTFSAAAVIRATVARHGRGSVAVAAPTGKAAVRITATMRRHGIDLDATTIHRLLEIGRSGHDGRGWGFQRNADNPLPQRFLVIDEVSMLDTDLAAALFAATEVNTHVLLVGDPYQLPPVGHGAPFRDLIAAGVPTAELTEIRRNAGLIVKACARIKDGRPFETSERFDVEAGLNLRHLEADTPEQAVELLRTVLERFKASGSFDPVWGVQVLTPLNEKSRVSRVELNKLLQGWLNPPTETDRPSEQAFRVNDRIICLRNCWLGGVRRHTGRESPDTIRCVQSYEPDSEAIRQAYSTVVTVSDKNDIQAFKITVSDDPHFSTIKADKRSRIQDSAITAEALLPGGPYDLWKEGEKSRRVKDLAGAFAQLPHLPKMLKADAIVDTLVEGCEQGAFVLRVTRPDGSFRTWWRSRPDETALKDPALELVLPEAAELAEIVPQQLAPKQLPELWPGEEISVQTVLDYFSGGKTVQIDRGGYTEAVPIPKASLAVVEKAVAAAVEAGVVWLRSGPASLLAETVPAGVLAPSATLAAPPAVIPAAEILPENLPDAWKEGETTALAVASALSHKAGQVLPWKTVRDAIAGTLQARFAELVDGSAKWPCEMHAAGAVRLKVAASGGGAGGTGGAGGGAAASKVLSASAYLEPRQIQDLADVVPRLLDIKAKSKVPIQFRIQVDVGDGKTVPPKNVAAEVTAVLSEVSGELQLR